MKKTVKPKTLLSVFIIAMIGIFALLSSFPVSAEVQLINSAETISTSQIRVTLNMPRPDAGYAGAWTVSGDKGVYPIAEVSLQDGDMTVILKLGDSLKSTGETPTVTLSLGAEEVSAVCTDGVAPTAELKHNIEGTISQNTDTVKITAKFSETLTTPPAVSVDFPGEAGGKNDVMEPSEENNT
jgi:hypothetical protein